MAQIPTVVAPTLTPPPEMNPTIAGNPGKAIAGAADEFASVADYGMQVADHIKKAQDEGTLLDASNKIDADIQHAKSELNAWTDFKHADELKQQTSDALREKYAEQYANRPDLWRHIEGYLGRELNTYGARVDVKSAQLTEEFNQATLTTSQRNTVNRAALAPTLNEKEFEWAQQDGNTDLMVRNGSISPMDGEKAKMLMRSQTIEAEVRNAANPMNRPEVMDAEMKMLNQYDGKSYVDPDKLAEMKDYLARQHEEAVTRWKEKDAHTIGGQLITNALSDATIVDTATGQKDFLKAAKNVADSDAPIEAKKFAQEYLEQQDGLQKRMTAENNKKIYDQESPRVTDLKQPLISSEVKNRALLPHTDPKWIPDEVKSQLLREIHQQEVYNREKNTTERMAMRQEASLDSADLLRSITSGHGYLQSEAELYQGEYAKLSKTDRKIAWSMMNIQGAKEYREAIDMMKNEYSVYPLTKEGAQKLSDDMGKLRQTVDEGKLVGPQIMEAAMQMVKPQKEAAQTSMVKTLLDGVMHWGIDPSDRQLKPTKMFDQSKPIAERNSMTGESTPRGKVTVQLPGEKPGQIPSSSLDKFKKDHPDAVVTQ